ncbi:nuclear transport factor 2 family protein [Pseudonocardia acidicola]|uniref:Nuclear transport factor 2 family protein n=1 Tax=Pseudonocardia acidicola TaxID=2724939 RepID=A0ABX1SJ97_9PSEU|nr:nuclear transport factor 2 family protein [Pseudonocardia acidicola]NMI01631.1 nuclear transport factor 2 family protein [Pseudonocardia acidicola]
MTSQTPETRHSPPAAAFRQAIENGDVDAAAALFRTDAVFHSPVVHKPYQGREALRTILGAVVQVFSDFRYLAEFDGPDGHVLQFRTRVGDRDLEGIDILRSEGGELTELTVMVRPYSAATELRARMAALLTG